MRECGGLSTPAKCWYTLGIKAMPAMGLPIGMPQY